MRTGKHLLGSDHNNRWHVAAERGGETVLTVFSPVLLPSQVTDQPREILTFGLSVHNPGISDAAPHPPNLLRAAAPHTSKDRPV